MTSTYPGLPPGDNPTWAEDPSGGPVSGEELEHLLDAAIETHGIPMQDTVTILPGIDITFAALDHGELSQANHQCRAFDIYTRELELQRSILSRSITGVNGRPVSDLMVLDKWLRKMPTAIINVLYERFSALRRVQEQRIDGLVDHIKKEPPSPLSESAGSSPSNSEPSHGTQG